MATVQDRAAPAARHDAAIEAQLARARRRIRGLDLAVAGLGLAALTLGYALAVPLLDRSLGLSAAARQIAFVGYLLAAGAYVGFLLVRPLLRPINPYFAARQIEQTIPGAKNSVINWLDLHDEELPSAIRGALGQRAARDLAKADLDQAVSGRRAAWMGGLTGTLLLAAFVAFVALGPPQFFSLLERAFRPFSSGGIASRTRLTLLRPEGGDVTVPAGRSVSFAVQVEGRAPSARGPDAPRLQYRYRPSDPYESLPMEPEGDREWTATLPASQVHNGFYYKVAGGDAETPEHRVTVRPTPLIESYQAVYKYRPYLHWKDDAQASGDLKALRGTEVTLTARANCPVKEGRLELETARAVIPGERVAGDPCALRFRLVLERDDRYRIAFTAADGEPNEPTPKTITVIPDYPPQLKITKPEEDETQVKANGQLKVEGWASDDIGVQTVVLKMQVVDGPELQPKVYREGTSFQLSDGGYPKMLDYLDSVDLASVKDRDGKDVALRPGMVLEYWLEASDACDYPGPNVGASKPRKRAAIAEPEPDKQKMREERKQTAAEQKQHQAKQDEKIKQEDQQRQQERNAGNQPNERPKDADQEKREQQLQKEADRVKDALDKKEQQEKERQEGQGKGDSQQEKGQGRDGGRPEQSGEQGRGETKPEGQPDPKQPPAEAKKNDAGQKPEDQGQAKGAGQSGGAEQQPGDAKKDQQQAQRSEGKGPGQEGGSGQQQGGAKGGGKPQPDNKTAQGQSKPAAPEKSDSKDTARSEAKGADQRPGGQSRAGGQEQARDAKPEDVRQLAKELQGGDAQKQQQAAEKLDQISRNAGDPKARDSARQALEKADQLPGKDAKPEDAKQQAREMQSADPQRQQQAADKLDQMARNAKDEKTREAARQALDKAERRPGENARPDDVQQPAKELQSGDGQKQQQAAEKLDQMARNAKDERVRDAARQALEKAAQQPGQNAKPDDVAKQEKGLQSGDAQQRRDAADKLEQISRNAKDQQARDAAREALEQVEKRPQESARPEDVARQAKELQSGDAKKEQQAAEKLDQMARNARDEQVSDAARKALEEAKQQPGQGAKPEDVAQQEKQLGQGGAKQQRDAADKLEQMARNAKDEKTREAARQALEEALKRAMKEQSPSAAKEPPPGQPPPDAATPKQGPPEKPPVQVSSGKGGDRKPETPEKGDLKDADPQNIDPQAKERGKPEEHPLAPFFPGSGDGRPDQRVLQMPEPPGGAADPRHRERGGTLQLDDLKKIDKQVRDELGWSEDRLRQFQKAYEEMMKRQAEARASDADKPVGPARGGSLSNVQAQPVKPVQGGPVDARSIGRGQPPPGYQDAEREFRRRIADLDGTPEKK